ncbi:MAG TPA: polysaccharide deacetylase family protein [Telluria sp.]|nr:polysaccharide deacetylase family protein [Telluria sp.]
MHIVVNVEYWPFDQPMPRKLIPGPHGNDKIPDVPNFSWVEYGMRTGFPRIVEALKRRGLPASTMLNATVIDVYPRAAEVMLDAGWEFIGHGWTQKALQNEPDEVAVIDKCMERIQRFTGKPMRGWMGAGLSETMNTPDVLKSRGVEYTCDWVIDDLPTWMRTKHGPLMSVPYSLDLNDGPPWAGWGMHSNVQYDRVMWTLETFEEELKTNCRVMALPLHPHLVGVPHRMNWFNKILDVLVARNDTVFVTPSEIADWYASVEPAPADMKV